MSTWTIISICFIASVHLFCHDSKPLSSKQAWDFRRNHNIGRIRKHLRKGDLMTRLVMSLFRVPRRYLKICWTLLTLTCLYLCRNMIGFWSRTSPKHISIPSLPSLKHQTQVVGKQSFHILQPQVTSPFPVAVSDKYVQVGHFDIKGNDGICQKGTKAGNCNQFQVRNSLQAMAICETYGDSCQGFVFEEKSGKLFLKNSIAGETVHTAHLQFYVKKSFQKNLKSIKIIKQGQCAVPVEVFQDLANSRCVLPVLDPFNKHIMKFMNKNVTEFQCPGKHYTNYKNGMLSVVEQDIPVKVITVQSITRKPHDDMEFILIDKVFKYPQTKSLKIDEDFLRVNIETSEGEKAVEFHAEVVSKPEVLQRKLHKGGLDVNVLMIGFDSTSSAQMQRALPEVYKYLKNELSSHIFQGYSIVGDGTTPQLTAMLTGHSEIELPEARRGFANTSTVDRWPWIFKEYRNSGYATLFSEDDPPYGSFTYRLHGFKDAPTDHYSRPFWQAAATRDYCIEARPQVQLQFSYIESFMRAYKKVPKFGLAFLSSVSHNNVNTLKPAQGYVLEFFKSIREQGFLDNTILMVFGDHGLRYGAARVTMQSKLEERLPFLSITLPKGVREKFPELDGILKENSRELTSPFDMHATLRDILSYAKGKDDSGKTGTSLFRRIADGRGCSACGIPQHYCPCVQLEEVPVTHLHVQKAAEGLVDRINEILNADRLSAEKCSILKLGEIKSAHQNLIHPNVTKFRGSKDIHGRIPAFADDELTKDFECNYHLLVKTVPGDALFEATVQLLSGTFHVEREISRVNKYGDQPKCVAKERPYMRKFCFCKDQNPN